MTNYLVLLNVVACGLISVVLAGGGDVPRIKEGLVIKTGLVLMCLGFWTLASLMLEVQFDGPARDYMRPLLLIHGGLAIVSMGAVFRLKQIAAAIKPAEPSAPLWPVIVKEHRDER